MADSFVKPAAMTYALPDPLNRFYYDNRTCCLLIVIQWQMRHTASCEEDQAQLAPQPLASAPPLVNKALDQGGVYLGPHPHNQPHHSRPHR